MCFRRPADDVQLVLLPFVSATSLLPAQSGDSSYVIRDVRVFDGETIVERQTVVISEGKIAAVGGSTIAVPAGAQDVAGEGRTLLPGLMDAHIHLPIAFPAEALQRTLAFGVTTAVVMWAPRRRRSIEADSRHTEHRRDLEAGRARSACA